ncbi:hypothetical protein [Lentilactobacillus sunkii]|uniref:hypothetical protein n=1 Tax=Lentilactobacillus sunkii TaxID=481719 RepID=UPI00159F6F43|nr:hypothetical protein [Lentilactobacillus sunkii]
MDKIKDCRFPAGISQLGRQSFFAFVFVWWWGKFTWLKRVPTQLMLTCKGNWIQIQARDFNPVALTHRITRCSLHSKRVPQASFLRFIQ